jgi:hypothetical protein
MADIDLPDALSHPSSQNDNNVLETPDGPLEAEKNGNVKLEDLFNSDGEDDEFVSSGAPRSSPNGKTEGSSPPPMYDRIVQTLRKI